MLNFLFISTSVLFSILALLKEIIAEVSLHDYLEKIVFIFLGLIVFSYLIFARLQRDVQLFPRTYSIRYVPATVYRTITGTHGNSWHKNRGVSIDTSVPSAVLAPCKGQITQLLDPLGDPTIPGILYETASHYSLHIYGIQPYPELVGKSLKKGTPIGHTLRDMPPHLGKSHLHIEIYHFGYNIPPYSFFKTYHLR